MAGQWLRPNDNHNVQLDEADMEATALAVADLVVTMVTSGFHGILARTESALISIYF